MTMAAAPLSSNRFIPSNECDRGLADGTIGFFSDSPRYVVERSILIVPSVRFSW